MIKIKFICLTIFLFISCNQVSKKQLPIFNPTDFNLKLVDKSVRKVSKNHTVREFNLINQNGANITSKDYENKIYVVDFFFTRCPSICPIMTDNMLQIQKFL
jgi:protein SCO1/2